MMGCERLLHHSALSGSTAVLNDGHAWLGDGRFVRRWLWDLSLRLWSILSWEERERWSHLVSRHAERYYLSQERELFLTSHSLCVTLSFCSRGISFSRRNSAISLSSSCSLRCNTDLSLFECFFDTQSQSLHTFLSCWSLCAKKSTSPSWMTKESHLKFTKRCTCFWLQIRKIRVEFLCFLHCRFIF